MTLELFLALALFASVAAYTPGPNNTLLMASGINHGFRASLPMIAGVGVGFPILIACMGLVLGKAFAAYPPLHTFLKYAGAAYMLWLAYKIATSQPAGGDNVEKAKPFTFLQGCAFQWVNPKAWTMGTAALSDYTLASDYNTGVATVCAMFVFMGFTSAATWTVFGMALKQVMNDPRWFRLINVGLAALLVVSLVPMLRH
jgi:threonine/homoserine/homoserine lactone efflux protein